MCTCLAMDIADFQLPIADCSSQSRAAAFQSAIGNRQSAIPYSVRARPHALELLQAAPHQLALVVGVEVPAEDLLGDRRRQVRRLLVDLDQRLVLRALDLLGRPLLGLFGLLL